MALLLKNNAIFLHIPKTGGTFVTHVLEQLNLIKDRVGREHADFARVFLHDRLHADDKVFRNLVRRRLGWLPKIDPKAFSFCFVREPLSWYVSYWRFMESINWRQWGEPKNPYHWHPKTALNGLGSPDFNEFMYKVNRKRPGFVSELYGWYNHSEIQFVGKQENLREDLMKVLSRLYPELDIRETLYRVPMVNESPSAIKMPEWDPEIRRETLKLEYASYVRYGYPIPNVNTRPFDKIKGRKLEVV